jgi:hypothetical protein
MFLRHGKRRPPSSHHRPKARLSLELLEDRVTPATYTVIYTTEGLLNN